MNQDNKTKANKSLLGFVALIGVISVNIVMMTLYFINSNYEYKFLIMLL